MEEEGAVIIKVFIDRQRDGSPNRHLEVNTKESGNKSHMGIEPIQHC